MKDVIISAEVLSIIVSIILLYGNVFETRQKTVVRKQFSILVLVNMIALITDMCSWLFDGVPEMSAFSYIMTLLSIVMSFIVSIPFVLYIYYYISEKRMISFSMFHGLIIFSTISFIIVTIACLRGYIFTIQDGSYQEGAYYSIYLFANAIALVYGFIVICFSTRFLGLHDSIAALSYIIIPLICMSINAINPDFSMVYPAITVSLLICYIMLQSEHENTLLQEEILKTHQVYHDDMTGLLNRRAYIEALETPGNDSLSYGVIFCDINGLKYTNDHYGHEAGDKLICSFTSELQNYFRKREIFRISGDEFVVLLPEISNELLNNRIEKLRGSMENFAFPPASIGSAFGLKGNITELIKAAEQDMYQEKQRFHSCFPQYRR